MSYLVEAVLKATDRGFSAAMNKASGSVKSLSGATQGAQGVVDKVFGSAGGFIKANIVMGAFNKVMGMVSGSIDGAIRRVDTINRFPKMMSAIGFSAEQSQASIEKLNKGVQGLPTSLDAVVSTTQRLSLMSGDLEKSTSLTLALNNAFLASGAATADAERGLVQYVQMMSKGKPDMMSWRTLQETMPYALTKTAEAFGYAGKSAQQDFYDALMSGKVTFDEFGDKLIELGEGVGGFADLAKKNSEGIATSMQNIRSALENFGRASINTINKVLESLGMENIAGQLDKVKSLIYKASGEFQPILKQWATDILSLSPAFMGLVGNVGAFGASIVALKYGAPILSGVNAAVGNIPSTVSKAKAGVLGLSQTFLSAVDSIDRFNIKSLSLADVLSGVGMTAKNSMGSLFGLMSTGMKMIAPAAVLGALVVGAGLVDKYMGGAISGWLSRAKADGGKIIENFASGIVSMIPSLAASGADLIAQFADAVSVNAPYILNAGIDIVFALVDGITSNAGSLITSAVSVISSFAAGIIGRLPDIATKGLEIISALIRGIASSIPTLAVKAAEAIGTFAGNIVGNLSSISSAGIDILLALIEGIATAIIQIPLVVLEIIFSFIDAITGKHGDVSNEGETLGRKLIEGLGRTWENIKQAGRQMIAKFVIGLLEGINNLLGGALDGFVNKLKSSYDKAEAVAEQSGAGVGKSMKGTAATVATASESMGKSITVVSTTMSKELGKAESIGANAGQGLANGLLSKVGAVSAAAEKLASSASGRMTRFLQIKSPSKVTARIGQYTGEGLALGIEDKVAEVERAAEHIASAATPKVAGATLASVDRVSDVGKPATINLNLGGRTFTAFVEDITNAQNAEVNLQMAFA